MAPERVDLGGRIRREMIDRDDAGLPELADVLEVLLEVRQPALIALTSWPRRPP